MQSVRGVLRQRLRLSASVGSIVDAIRAGCAEAKNRLRRQNYDYSDAIRAGCADAKVSIEVI